MNETLNNTISTKKISEGDRVYLVLDTRRRWIRTIKTNQEFHSDKGKLVYNELLNKPYGQLYKLSPSNLPIAILPPLITDIIFHMKRESQIIYPEDIGAILAYSGIGPGKTILEAGTGSGTVTGILAQFIARNNKDDIQKKIEDEKEEKNEKNGKITSFDIRPKAHKQAKRNLQIMGILDYCDLKLGNICEEKPDIDPVDFIMLDLATPWEAVPNVASLLKDNGIICCFSPVIEQIKKNKIALSKEGMTFIHSFEILTRTYQIKPNATRPHGRMVGHTWSQKRIFLQTRKE